MASELYCGARAATVRARGGKQAHGTDGASPADSRCRDATGARYGGRCQREAVSAQATSRAVGVRTSYWPSCRYWRREASERRMCVCF